MPPPEHLQAAARLDGRLQVASTEAAGNSNYENSKSVDWKNEVAPRVAEREQPPHFDSPANQPRPLAMAGQLNENAATAGGIERSPHRGLHWGDELKSFLAAFGLAAIALQVLRIATRN
jgi:hypothetical protein